MTDKFIAVGYTRKTHGSQGELRITIKDEFFEDFSNADAVFLNVNGKPLPFFVENLRDIGDLLLKVEEINSTEEAKMLTSKEIFLRESDIKAGAAEIEILPFHELKGFLLFDEDGSEVGEIIDIEKMPMQYLAVVVYQGAEVFIPLHNKMVVSIDNQAKKLTLRLPEGLLEL